MRCDSERQVGRPGMVSFRREGGSEGLQWWWWQGFVYSEPRRGTWVSELIGSNLSCEMTSALGMGRCGSRQGVHDAE